MQWDVSVVLRLVKVVGLGHHPGHIFNDTNTVKGKKVRGEG